MSCQGDVSVRRLAAGMDLDEASLGQNYGAGGDGADDTVAVLAIFDELEEGPGVVRPYYVAAVDRGNPHKITKELAFYDADARGGLDFLAVHPSSTGKLGSIGICIGGRLPFRAAFPVVEDAVTHLSWVKVNGHRLASERPAVTTEPATGEADGSE